MLDIHEPLQRDLTHSSLCFVPFSNNCLLFWLEHHSICVNCVYTVKLMQQICLVCDHGKSKAMLGMLGGENITGYLYTFGVSLHTGMGGRQNLSQSKVRGF